MCSVCDAARVVEQLLLQLHRRTTLPVARPKCPRRAFFGLASWALRRRRGAWSGWAPPPARPPRASRSRAPASAARAAPEGRPTRLPAGQRTPSYGRTSVDASWTCHGRSTSRGLSSSGVARSSSARTLRAAAAAAACPCSRRRPASTRPAGAPTGRFREGSGKGRPQAARARQRQLRRKEHLG